MSALGSQPEKELLVVTGAASGIGRAMVAAGSALGCKVLALDIQNAGAALQAENSAAGGEISFLQCDVGSPDDWAAIANKAAKMGGPTHIHLNAGIQIAPPDAPLSEYQFEAMQLDRYQNMMSVNVDGVVFGLRALLPLCEPGAAIVVTSSLAGITPYSVDPLYSMSKHAVSGLVRSLGPTLEKRGIKINAICPGGIDTAIIPHAQRNTADGEADTTNLMTPEHVAEEVLHLMTVPESGKTWAKLHAGRPVYIIRAPGDREGREQKGKGQKGS